MRTVFKPDISKRKTILKAIACKHRQWYGRMLCMNMLFVMAVLIIIGTVILLICNPTTLMGVFVFMAAGGCFAAIPFVIGLSVKNTAKYKCAFPYSSYAMVRCYLTMTIWYIHFGQSVRMNRLRTAVRVPYTNMRTLVFSILKLKTYSPCTLKTIFAM